MVIDLDEAQKLLCLDAKTAAVRWARPLLGRDAAAWASDDGILAANGSPLDIVKLDPATGNVRWRATPPDTALLDGDLVSHPSADLLTRAAWRFSAQFAVVVDKQVVHLLDYATGKLSAVALGPPPEPAPAADATPGRR